MIMATEKSGPQRTNGIVEFKGLGTRRAMVQGPVQIQVQSQENTTVLV